MELPRLARPKGCFAAYDLRRRSKDDALRTDSDTSGGIQPTPSEGGEGQQSWHYDTPLISAFYDWTQAPLPSDYGPAGAAGAWATPPHPPGPQDRLREYGQAADAAAELLQAPQDLPGTTGRPRAADAAVDSAGAAEPPEELRARRICWMAMPEYTAASRRHDHATFLERADASVRCSGF
jgi:hypothetical protein